MPQEVDEWHDRLGGFVRRPTLEEYADKYSDHFVVERDGGVIELRMHSKGGAAVYSQMTMDRPRPTRRLTHAIVQRPFRRRLLEDHGFGMAHELFGVFTDRSGNRG